MNNQNSSRIIWANSPRPPKQAPIKWPWTAKTEVKIEVKAGA